MKKKYQRPLIKVLSVENEPLLNGSVVTYEKGETVDTMGSDNTSGGQEGENNTVWGDAKPHNPWTSWD